MQNSNTAKQAMITFQGVSKSYGKLAALHPVDFTVYKGEFLSLLGPSGSGKSTILNIIAGAIAPSSGQVWLDGRDVARVPARERQLGMVFQNYALLPHLSVYDNVAFPLKIRGVGAADIRQRVGNALERVGLLGYEQRKPREMSGGQQQRVGIARCIVYRPAVILMDEPLGALDKKLRDQLQGEIKRLHKDLKTTLLYVTHDQEEALNLSDRVCLMNGGRIAQLGTPDELYFEPCSEFVADFVGESNLFAGVVSGPDRVQLDDGWPLTVRSTTGFAVGERVKVMVRPEKIAATGAETVPPGHDHPWHGTLTQVSFISGMTRYEVSLHNGRTVLFKAISERTHERLLPGTALTLSWASRDSVVIREESA